MGTQRCASARPTFALAADETPFGVIVFDRDGSADWANAAWTNLTGQSPRRAQGNGWLDALAYTDRADAASQLKAVMRGESVEPVEWRIRAPRRRPGRWARARFTCIHSEEREVTGFLAFVDDTDDAHVREAQLRYQATHDPLTGTLNRAQFIEHMRHALARLARKPGTLAVAFVDLDNFKEVNDTHGHRVGDHVLATQAQRLHQALRPSDVIGRFGGDEFVVLCEDLGSRGRRPRWRT